MDVETEALVIDNGSGSTKAGVSGEDFPIVVLPTVVCKSELKNFVGENAYKQELPLKYPIERGVITDFDAMIAHWNYTFLNELRYDPEDQPLFLTETTLNEKKNREKITEIMFEHFKVPSFYLGAQGILSLYASGRNGGLVLEMGDGIISAVPMYEGLIELLGVEKLNLGGIDFTNYLNDCITKKGYSLKDKRIAMDIKEKFCYIALNYDEELKKDSIEKKSYDLPDGKVIELSTERFQCSEGLFNPSILKNDSKSIHELIHSSIHKLDTSLSPMLFNNIVLSGGCAMFEGISERLEKEIKRYSNKNARIVSAPERKYNAWVGGSILSSLTTFQQSWISKEEFQESGSKIVNQKCL